MPDEDIPDQLHPWDQNERDVLYLLTEPADGQPLWSVEDIGREISGDTDDAETAVRALKRAGLVNLTSDGYVFANRAAVRVIQLSDTSSDARCERHAAGLGVALTRWVGALDARAAKFRSHPCSGRLRMAAAVAMGAARRSHAGLASTG